MNKNEDSYQLIHRKELKLSATNPRRHIDENELNELAESIKQHGILQPLLIRKNCKGYEIVAGERRYRAALKANLEKLPVIIKSLTDQEVVEIQLIENLQRKDVHPLDEAYGFKNLLEISKFDTKTIAEKIGKNEAYVYSRLKLLDLEETVQLAFQKNEIHLGHALIIARLQPEDQKRALEYTIDGTYSTFGKEKSQDAISIASLKNWVSSNILLDLKKASFDKKDTTLLPLALACINCAKRTGFNKSLFPEIEKEDYCTDPICFNGKKTSSS